jgi:hypothetical protein
MACDNTPEKKPEKPATTTLHNAVHRNVFVAVLCNVTPNLPKPIGGVYYRFCRAWFASGILPTLPTFASGIPYMWIDDKWTQVTTTPRIMIEWTREVEVICELPHQQGFVRQWEAERLAEQKKGLLKPENQKERQ